MRISAPLTWPRCGAEEGACAASSLRQPGVAGRGSCARPAAAGSAARAMLSGGLTRRAPRQLGKLDLTEVEGLADLLAAETAAQHRQARAQPARRPSVTRRSGRTRHARVCTRGVGAECRCMQGSGMPGWWRVCACAPF